MPNTNRMGMGMNRLNALIVAGLLTGASIGVARAADILPPAPKLDDGNGDSALDPNSGWYLRGDVGLDAYNNARFKSASNPLINAGSALQAHNRSNQPNFIAGLGVGYRYNDWLRFDVTGEAHGDAKFATAYSLLDPSSQIFGRPGGTLFTGTHSAKLSSYVGLANVYFDVLTWHGITPYAGAGVGIANVHLSSASERGTLIDVNAAATPIVFNAPGGTKTNFAWAVTTGISYDLTTDVKLDLSYRYLNIGSAPSQREHGSLFKVSSASIGEQDIRLGVRWMFTSGGK